MPQMPPRLLSIDAFRGFTMICMFSEGFGLLYFLNHPAIGPVARQFTHSDWNMSIPGDLRFWDLIQPFFMFIVGIVMPVSFARRWAAGETWSQSLRHVLRRSAVLILLGLVARSAQAGHAVLDLINVLAQIAFTYLVAFLLLRTRWTVQGATALGLLAVHWALYRFASASPWDKNANIGWYLDQLILHKNWGGWYATINCLSSAANTIFGVMAGKLLQTAWPAARKMKILAASGVAGVAAGLLLGLAIPLNKKIWTASFALYSAGATVLVLLLFYWICDVRGKRRWAAPLVVVGSNSLFIYMFHETQHRAMGNIALSLVAGPFGKMLAALLVIAFEIWICFWLYRRKIFFKA